MELGEIFKDALKYPISDYKQLLIIGILILISSLDKVLWSFGIIDATFSAVWSVVALIVGIIVIGYGVRVLKNAIELDDMIPAFDWISDFVNGIKLIVITIIYFIIPTIIVAIIGFVSFSSAFSTLSAGTLNQLASIESSSPEIILNSIPPEVWSGMFGALAITAVIAIILFIIFGIFENIAICRMAKYDRLGEAFQFGEIYNDIREIGILKIIGFLIIALIISFIIGVVISIITAIPFVGLIIACLVGYSFILLFNYRALGLLYSEI